MDVLDLFRLPGEILSQFLAAGLILAEVEQQFLDFQLQVWQTQGGLRRVQRMKDPFQFRRGGQCRGLSGAECGLQGFRVKRRRL